MRPNNIEDIYPLSPMQQGILFHTLVAASPETYFVQLAWTLRGPLDVAAFHRAWQEVVDRHPALRTAFAWEKLDAPVQIVWKRLKLPFEQHDLRDLPAAERAERARRFVEEDRKKGFDPSRAPLIRIALLRLADDAYRFVWSTHHLLFDGWSHQMLVKEVFGLYDAYAKGRELVLPRPRPFSEYIGWLGKQDPARAAEFWRKELAGITAPTPLGVDRPASAAEPARFGERRRTVSQAATTALTAFARQHQLTINTVVQGAWALLLSRYSRERDVVFGCTVSGRSAPVAGIEAMIGLFINTLAVRVHVDPAAPVLGFLTALQAHEAELRDHEHSALADVQALSAVPGGTPLFESLVVFENFPITDPPAGKGGGGPALAVVDSQSAEQPPYPLTLVVVHHRALDLKLGYDARRFDEAAIDRILGHLGALLEGFAAHGEAPVGELSLLGQEERRLIVETWAGARTAYPRDASIHALFDAQAARTPDAIAVTFGDERASYAELRERANRLAHVLRDRGVRDDAPVGLYARRSVDMVVATLAILKAGGAYVPLDPALPPARLAWLLDDAGIALVVATSPVVDAAPLARAAILQLADERAALAAASAESPPGEVGPGGLAYLMYTSGSTGTPKGVCVTHRNVVRLVKDTDYARFGADEVFLQLAPIAFDAATLELWGPLLNGGRLAVFPDELPSPARVGEVIAEQGVTTMWLTSGLFNAMVDGNVAGLAPLRQLLAGGEALSVPHVQAALAALPGVKLINGYGPTEGTTFTTCHAIQPADLAGAIPIGKPIANTTVYILDENLAPVPVGVPGELYVGGDGVARGYLNRPELTRERFVADPFAREPGGRLYRTGDLVRWLEGGTIAFLGRLDQQVKLRGFRIELGEIEAALGARPEIAASAVIVREDAPGDRRLVAYLVGSGLPGPAELRAYLKERLPEYMVPAAYVALEALPLTVNGKLDRRALPAPEASGLERDYVAPRGPVEEALAGIFAEVLKLPTAQVGGHDDFFALGGHSLLATQAVSRVRAAFGVELPLRAIFDAPSPAALAPRIEASLSTVTAGATQPITRVTRGEEVPLSFGQERMWFLAQLDPASPAYVVASALRLAGALDKPALAAALAEMVRRHEVLRTAYRAVDGKPRGFLLPPAAVALPETSLAALPEHERDRAVRAAAEAEARRPFDLTQGPILRAELLALAPDDHVLLLTSHHIVIDGWTQGILNRELGALYEAFRDGKPSPLPELPIQYGDFAAWQRAFLSGDVLARQLAYWTAQLGGAEELGPLELPTDRPRPPVPSYRGAARTFTLPRELSAAVRALARREGVTLYMAMLAAFDVLLHRYSGQEDIVVGTPIAGRQRAETEHLAGLFLNTLVMRARVSPEMTFKELLARVKEVSLGAYAHQDMPFERLVQELSPRPDPSRSPIFQVIFNLQNAPRHGVSLPGLKLRGAVAENATVKVDLTLIMGDMPDGLVGRLEYSTDLFDAATIERMARHFETLVAGLVKEPQKRLREISLLAEEERRRVLVGWNDTAASLGAAACFHELFEAQVDRAPEAPALVAGGERLTYAELEARANRLAHHLRARGVGPDVVVGLCLPRTADLVVALLGILKAGGAYVPLDPAYPARRLGQILGEARAAVAVTDATLAEKLAGSGATVVRLDADAIAIAAESDARPALDATPGDLAYVLFTSGSTGAPKGVAIEHRQLVNYVRGIEGRLALPAGASYAYVSTFSADLGNTVLFPSLATGGVLHVIAQELATDPDGLGAYFAREGIDCLKIVPSHLSALLTSARAERVIPRRLLVLGGEASTWELMDRLERLAPDCRIMNHYGPTETTVGVLTYPVEKGARPPTAIVPLGRPLPNSRVYVLDAQMSPTPVGVPGEVYIGGAGVARGYLNQPELTRERFVKDPFSTAPGARLYRTGDRARALPDGTLVFLGRIDFQVKIRGFRIELGEIEAALASYPALKEAVVLVEEESPGDKRLVAYVVPVDPAPDLAAARAHLEQRLPEYMVPSSFVVLTALPLTPNGKIDRRALAAIERRREDAVAAAPRNPTEEVLAAIWADVFEREQVSIHDRFAELGGHSLLAIQIIARARDAFQVQIPLRAIFEAPTVASLAERVEALRLEDEGLVALPIEPVSRDGELQLSFSQERLWFLDRFEPDTSTYNVPAGLRLAGPVDVGALERALREILRRHEVLRTTFALGASRTPVQIIHAELPFALPVEDLGGVPEAEREAHARARATAEGARPFDLSRGPLLRARLLRLGPGDHVLVLTLHHIVSDARTQAILREEIDALYEAFREGRPSPLPELPVQYADYAAWQRRWLSGEVLDKQLAYWRGALAAPPPPLDLPADRPRPPVMGYAGGRRQFQVPAAARKALGEVSRREGATLFMTLLAAFDVLLQRYTGQSDLVVGTPMTNRTRAETEGLIGFFLNTLVLRTQLADDLTFVELLGRVRDACLGAYAHQDMPFERLVTELSPERDLSRTPIFQVMFTVQTTPPRKEGPAAAPRVRGAAPDLDVAKFDLSLGFVDGPGGLRGAIEYRTDLFDAATIDRLAAHLVTLLGAIGASPEARLADLPLLPAEETRTLEVTWNDTRAEYPREADLVSLFAAQAARVPTATAVTCEAQALTYGELDRRSNRLARALRARGVRRGDLVGIAVDRGVGMVVALLGILKAGGAYVPLDPTYPAERLTFMATDSGLRLLVTESRFEGVAREHDCARLRLDADAAAIEAESDAPLGEPADPEGLAYVIYTSGSTGKPKGVELPHRAVVNFLYAMRAEPGLAPEDRLLAVTSLSFDIAGLELWLPLTTGAEVEIATREVAFDGAALKRKLDEGRITVMQATPSTWRMVLEAGFAGSPRLRVLVGGEALPRDLADKLAERAASVWNMYGPTETTIWSCVHRVRAGAPVLIGRPIANTLAYVLDAARRLAPIGVPGELYLGGESVARGYLGRPELTEQRFVPNPFGAGRIYRTGDLCRFRADGALEFIGRVDHQIKLRGHRIELGEIEAVLEEQPALRQAVVVVREDVPGDQRLVAYLVAAEGGPPTVEALRAAVRAKLPEIMVPSAFVTLDAMPLTPNGKVDRKALPAPAERANLADTAAVGPRDETEFRLAAIWRSVLGVKAVGVHDSFFDLGGHSMLAVRMMSEVEQAFGKSVPLMALFEAQTIAKLAVLVTAEGSAEREWPALVAIRGTGKKRPLFVVSRPNVNSLGYIALVRHLDPEQPVFGLQMAYPEETQLGRPYTLDERRGWAQTYLERMRAVQPEGPYLIAGMCEGALIAFDMVRHLEAHGEQVKLLAMIDTWPEENTTDLRYHHVYRYERAVRLFLALPPERRLGFLRWRAAKSLRTLGARLGLRKSAPARATASRAAPAVNPWEVRMFPGPSFVPPKVNVRIDVFRTRGQPYWRIDDRELAWGSRTSVGVDLHFIDGLHHTFMREEHVATLARPLQLCLRNVEEDLEREAMLAAHPRRVAPEAKAPSPATPGAQPPAPPAPHEPTETA
jgi:amino acid adenylation domain-containing protein